ncbi:MAG: 23S rRNA (pseudouridine(1915)-N(3))-methyltransferase RlmH, partial [Tidjanibacter sp.]|nr:23S rRNA (pseudouridine(1915)-N(3))-methyltransferase RlmH [Tidjanibacter sp.]
MNIELIVVGKTDSAEVTKLVEMYSGRINFFVKFAINIVPDIKNSKNLSQNQQKQLEGEAILNRLSTGDRVVLID